MPDIGTDEAVELIEVCVKVGDAVAEGDSLVVLESDKASMEVPAPAAGEVLEILVAEGGSVKQGDPLLRLQSVAGDSIAPAPAPAPAAASAPVPAGQPKPIAKAAAPAAAPAKPAAAAPASSKDIYAGPAVRKLAREFGVELGLVTGTGPRGRILKEDLQSFVQNSLKAGPAAAAAAAAHYRRFLTSTFLPLARWRLPSAASWIS